MANQFDKPVSNKYVSQYVKAPVQALKTAGARYQKRSDKNRKKAFMLRKSMEQDPLPEHEDMVNDRLERHQKDLDQITEDGDYLNAGSRINDKVLEFKNDQVLKAARDAKKQKQQISKSIDEDLSDAPKNFRDYQKSKIQVGDLEVDADGNVEAQVSGPTYPKYLSPSERQEYMNNEIKRFAETYDGPKSKELSGITTVEGIQNYLQTADVSSVTKNRIRTGLASSVTDEQLKFAQEYANANPLQHLTEETYEKIDNGDLSIQDVNQNPQKFVRDETQIYETNKKGEPVYRNEKGEVVSKNDENAIIQVNPNTMWGGLISAKSIQKSHESVQRDLREMDKDGSGGPGGPGEGNGNDALVGLTEGSARLIVTPDNYNDVRKAYQNKKTAIENQEARLDKMEEGTSQYLAEQDKLRRLRVDANNYQNMLTKVDDRIDFDKLTEVSGAKGYDQFEIPTPDGKVIDGDEAREKMKEGIKKGLSAAQVFPSIKRAERPDTAGSGDAPLKIPVKNIYEEMQEQYNKAAKKQLQDNEITSQPVVLSGTPDGEYKTKIGHINERNSRNFGEGDGWSAVGPEGKSARQALNERIGAMGEKVEINKSSGKEGTLNGNYEVQLTTETTEDNNPMFKVTAMADVEMEGETKEMPAGSIYITKGNEGMQDYRVASQELRNSSLPNHRKKGIQMAANLKYMGELKEAGIPTMQAGDRRQLNLRAEDTKENLYAEKTEQGYVKVIDEEGKQYARTAGGISQLSRNLFETEANIRQQQRSASADGEQDSERNQQKQAEEDDANNSNDSNEDSDKTQEKLPPDIRDTKDPVTGQDTNPDKVIRLNDDIYNFTSYAADTEWGSKVEDHIMDLPDNVRSANGVDKVLQQYDESILKGKSQAILDVAEAKNIDPRMLLAVIKHESRMGTSSVAQENNNFGGITWNSDFAESQKGTARPGDEGGYYVKFDTPKEGLKMQADLIAERKMNT